MLAVTFPVATTLPSVTFPPAFVVANVSQEAAAVPSAGHTFNVPVEVLYQSCPFKGFGGGVSLEKFSTILTKF